MSFFSNILETFNNIELYDYVKVIGKHDNKGNHGLITQIKKTDTDEIYVVELQTSGKKIRCQKSNLRKLYLKRDE